MTPPKLPPQTFEYQHTKFEAVKYRGFVSDIKRPGKLYPLIFNTDNVVKCDIEVNSALSSMYSKFSIVVYGEQTTTKYWRYAKQLQVKDKSCIYRHTLNDEITNYQPTTGDYQKSFLLSDMNDTGYDCGIEGFVVYLSNHAKIPAPDNITISIVPGQAYGEYIDVIATSILDTDLSLDGITNSILLEMTNQIMDKMIPRFDIKPTTGLKLDINKYLHFLLKGKI